MKKILFTVSLFILTAGLSFGQPGTKSEEYKKGLACWEQKDYTGALSWFIKGLDKDDTDCMLGVGAIYGNGLGVEVNSEFAVSLFAKAMERKHPVGFFNMGVQFYYGAGVPKDTVKAVQLYTTAADMGYQRAMEVLADAYDSGIGAPRDEKMAAYWYNKMDNKGPAQLISKRAELKKAAISSGKNLSFSSFHNFNASFSPRYDRVILHSAQGYEANDAGVTYTKIDYRAIDLKTMNYVALNKTPYKWNIDYSYKRPYRDDFDELKYIAAFAPGSAPDSLERTERLILSQVMKPKDDKYMEPEGKFIRQLSDGSLIYAVINKKWSTDKADIELYRQATANNQTLTKFYVIKRQVYPDLNVVVSDDGKRVLFIDHINITKCPVFDVPSDKQVAKINMGNDWFYTKGAIIKFTPSSDSLISVSHPRIASFATCVIKTDKKVLDIPVPITQFDELTEEFGFTENEKYKNVRLDKFPMIMDFTPDGKKMLVGTTNKLAIVSMDGSPARFISTPRIKLDDVIKLRVTSDDVYPKASARRTEIFAKVREEFQRKTDEYNAAHTGTAAADRLANEERIAEYRRTHPNTPIPQITNPATGLSAAEKEAQRHRNSLDNIERNAERRARGVAERQY